MFPHFLIFAKEIGYEIELATYQNWYPDLTFISQSNPSVKFAVDLKTTYRDENYPGFCNGFTLGSHGEYFINRTSTKIFSIHMMITAAIFVWALFIQGQ